MLADYFVRHGKSYAKAAFFGVGFVEFLFDLRQLICRYSAAVITHANGEKIVFHRCINVYFAAGFAVFHSVIYYDYNHLLQLVAVAHDGNCLLRFIECDEEGLITDEAFDAAVGEKTKIVAMTQVSNVLGVRNDIKKFAEKAHKLGALFVCDGAQSVPHFRVDVQALGVDFLAFSGHKMCGPMGIGVLYGREKLLEEMPPFLTGGEMIEYVTREGATWAELPHKFEAGTVNAGGAVGLAAAIDYYNKIGRENIEAREQYLGNIAFEALKSVPHLNLLGPREASLHNGIFTFTIDGVHPHDIAEIMNADRICIRAGHHCAQPLMKFLNTPSTARVSLMFYNTEEEILRLEESLKTVRGRMGYAE